MGYKDGIQYIKDIISITGKFVDEIHVQGDDFGENEIMSFDDLGKNIGKKIDVHIVQWIDDKTVGSKGERKLPALAVGEGSIQLL